MELLAEVAKAILIGIVEGVSEWLPISSTGHMIIVDEFVRLDVSADFLSFYLVVIQLGAILAVFSLYTARLNPFGRQKPAEQRRDTWRLWLKVAMACLPAAVIGLLFDDWVEEHFFNAVVVAVALIVYGVAFIVVERLQGGGLKGGGRLHGAQEGGAHQDASHSGAHRRHLRTDDPDAADRPDPVDGLESLSWLTAFQIGCFQCLAIIPGTSRSGSTILGGRILGVSRQVAAEFSFFLAIPVMFGWSLLKAVKTLLIDRLAVSPTEWLLLAVGIAAAYIVSRLAIRFLMAFIKEHSFTAFGWYRIGLGLVVLAYFGLTGGLLA